MGHDDVHGDDALLAALAGALDDESAWSPGVSGDAPLAALPGRQPGEALETRTHPVAGARAHIADCGTSRLEGYTHVLLISEIARSALGPLFDQLAPAIAARLGSEGFAWEGDLNLHVRAPGRVWEDVLRTARDAVAALVAPEAEAG